MEVVDVEDVYDEFSHGLMLREAIAAFISHAYHNWERPPQYVLLLGDATFDYRNIMGGGHPSYVPTLYYNARRRGNSPSDYLFSLVDGDDLLPDIAVGRLAAETAVEAEGVVDKIVGYDTDPAPGDWRSRVIYLANHHPKNEFTRPSDELASRFSEPFGLQSVKIYNPDEEHLPNPTGKAFLDALNAGALLVNFNGHGSAGTMQYLFSLQFPDWDYLSQVDNGPRLPLVTAFSCLNGMFVNPHTEAIGEVFTDRADGGSIAYISASALSFTSQNDLLGQQLYGQFFTDGTLAFGPALNAAKAQVLAAHPSWTAAALTMQLFGDPAQELALPRLPDYQPRELTTGEELLSGGTVPVAAVLANNTRATRDSVTVLVAARGETTDDTLYLERLAPFVGSRRLSFDWRIGDRRGEHLLEVVLDPEDLVAELDEGNNAAAAAVDILSPVVPELLFPPAGAVLPVAEASFEAVVEGEGGQVEFQLSTAGDFASDSSTVSPAVEVEGGIAVFAPALPEGPWFWRARAVDGVFPGPWSAIRFLWLSEEASVPPGDRLRWGQTAVQMAGAGLEFLELDGDLLRVSRSSTPLRPGSATREDGYTVRGLKGAGVLVTDGTYLYAKRWFNDSSTIYPGTDFFTRIGTGLNGSVRARNYGVFGGFDHCRHLRNLSRRRLHLQRKQPRLRARADIPRDRTPRYRDGAGRPAGVEVRRGRGRTLPHHLGRRTRLQRVDERGFGDAHRLGRSRFRSRRRMAAAAGVHLPADGDRLHFRVDGRHPRRRRTPLFHRVRRTAPRSHGRRLRRALHRRMDERPGHHARDHGAVRLGQQQGLAGRPSGIGGLSLLRDGHPGYRGSPERAHRSCGALAQSWGCGFRGGGHRRAVSRRGRRLEHAARILRSHPRGG